VTRTKYWFTPAARVAGRETFNRLRVHIVAPEPRPRYPRRLRLTERLAAAWAAFWGAAR
jgi:hypothetical protein